jgi:hypothetical protein
MYSYTICNEILLLLGSDGNRILQEGNRFCDGYPLPLMCRCVSLEERLVLVLGFAGGEPTARNCRTDLN